MTHLQDQGKTQTPDTRAESVYSDNKLLQALSPSINDLRAEMGNLKVGLDSYKVRLEYLKHRQQKTLENIRYNYGVALSVNSRNLVTRQGFVEFIYSVKKLENRGLIRQQLSTYLCELVSIQSQMLKLEYLIDNSITYSEINYE